MSSQYPPGRGAQNWPPPNQGQSPQGWPPPNQGQPPLGWGAPGQGPAQYPRGPVPGQPAQYPTGPVPGQPAQYPTGSVPGQPGPDRRKPRRGAGPVRWFFAVVLTLFAIPCVAGGIAVTGQSKSASDSQAAQANAAAQTQTAESQWATTPVTKVFPATVTATTSGIMWDRVAIDSSTSCTAALTADWQPNSTQPCTAVLRATYTDQAHTIAATVGVIVNPSSTDPPGASTFDTWLTPMSDAQEKSEGVGASQTSVDFVIHALAAPGTAAANFGDADLLGMAAGNLMKGAPSDWLALVVETGSLGGQRIAGNLPSPWAAESGGNHRDRDSWYIPAQNLTTALDDYYQKLFG